MRIAVVLGLIFAGSAWPQTSVTLEQAVEEALNHNLDLAAERLSIPIAEARQITAALRPNPVLTVSAQTLDLLGTKWNVNNPSGPNQLTTHTDFILERGQKREQRMAVASSERGIAELTIRELIRRVTLDVQSAYVDVQQASDNLTLAQDNLKSLQGIVQINETKVKAGDLAEVELDRSRIAALQSETNVERARLLLDQARLRLQLLLGRTNNIPEVQTVGPMRRDIVKLPVESIRQHAIESRPDLLTVRAAEARNRADLRLQLAYGKADLTVGAEVTRQWTGYGSANSLGFSLSVPLRVYNRNQGEIARAQREITQTAARLTAAQAGVATEVETAWRQYNSAQRLLNNIETNMLAKAKSVREITEYSYRRGEASLVEFLDAQRAFNETVQSYNEARATYARSLYLLESASATSISGGY
ncbi:MAG: TolC family protein [Bryobacterales bacterium]|nr:TolC family protein [Bryobacterales bacterium]